MNHLELGTKGEDLAQQYLSNKGLRILERNYRFGKGELDIICVQDELLVIVEVKTRKTNVFGEPFTAVSRKKQRQIIQIANRFIHSRGMDLEVRFDVISVVIDSGKSRLEHIPGAFTP